MPPPTKLSLLLDAMRRHDYGVALKIAAHFPRIGDGDADRKIIKSAHEANVHPRFYVGLGKDPQVLVKHGIERLYHLWGHLLGA